MTIGSAAAHDEGPIREILAACGLPWADLTPSLLQHFLVLKKGRDVLGCVGLEAFENAALLRSLAVGAEARHQGWGAKLVEGAEEHARSLGIRVLYLLTLTAVDFFARRRYERLERAAAPASLQETAEFLSLCPTSAVCMAKPLDRT